MGPKVNPHGIRFGINKTCDLIEKALQGKDLSN